MILDLINSQHLIVPNVYSREPPRKDKNSVFQDRKMRNYGYETNHGPEWQEAEVKFDSTIQPHLEFCTMREPWRNMIDGCIYIQ